MQIDRHNIKMQGRGRIRCLVIIITTMAALNGISRRRSHSHIYRAGVIGRIISIAPAFMDSNREGSRWLRNQYGRNRTGSGIADLWGLKISGVKAVLMDLTPDTFLNLTYFFSSLLLQHSGADPTRNEILQAAY